MKVNKNWCSACSHNFFTESMFFEHRTGEFSTGKVKQPVGVSPRRCLTVEEMSIKGWVLRTLDVDVIVEGERSKQAMSTWVLPGQVEAREAKSKRMSAMTQEVGFKKGHKSFRKQKVYNSET